MEEVNQSKIERERYVFVILYVICLNVSSPQDMGAAFKLIQNPTLFPPMSQLSGYIIISIATSVTVFESLLN